METPGVYAPMKGLPLVSFSGSMPGWRSKGLQMSQEEWEIQMMCRGEKDISQDLRSLLKKILNTVKSKTVGFQPLQPDPDLLAHTNPNKQCQFHSFRSP